MAARQPAVGLQGWLLLDVSAEYTMSRKTAYGCINEEAP